MNLEATEDELDALFAATFTQEKRIQSAINQLTDGMLIAAIGTLHDDLTRLRSARRKIEMVLLAERAKRQ